MAQKYLDAVVLERRELTSRISEFVIGAADRSPLPTGDAGSHIEVRFGAGDGRYVRHYSLVGPLSKEPLLEPYWRIAVQREDRSRGSAYIHANFREGTRLKVSRPAAPFRLRRDVPHVLLVAGGVGITAILPMLRSLVIRKRPVSFVYIGRGRSDMAYADDVLDLGGEAVRLHFTGVSGRPDFAGLLEVQPEGTEAYICGPGSMVDDLRRVAAQMAWPASRVHHEIFNSAHRADDGDVRVELRGGREILVGAGTTVLEALEAAGVETYSDCRRGECGLCVTDVISDPGEIDHRDHYFTDEQKRTVTRMCICVSRVRAGAQLKLDIG